MKIGIEIDTKIKLTQSEAREFTEIVVPYIHFVLEHYNPKEGIASVPVSFSEIDCDGWDLKSE